MPTLRERWVLTPLMLISSNYKGGGVVTNFIRVATDTFTCEFNESGKTENVVPVEPEPEYEMVDLGLPSGLKWANKNIGAESPEDYGLYFAFGATEGYKPEDGHDFSLANCPYYDSATGQWTKYAIKGENLESEDDAASVILGNGWRMPTEADMFEIETAISISRLLSVQLQENVLKLINPSTGAFILVPLSGEIDGLERTDPEQARLRGATVVSDAERACQLVGYVYPSFSTSGGRRYRGQVIRPVHD